MIVGIHHVAISVPDLARAIEFYTEAFGFTTVQRSSFEGDQPLVDAAIGLPAAAADMAMLRAPNAFIELWQYRHPEPVDKRSRPCDLGYPHFALQVDDIDSEVERLKSHGMTFVGPKAVNFGSSSALYGADPFGNIIELYDIRDANTAQLARNQE
ncbi:MAG: VOC family protein [Pseudomonadaceae bacterium]|nr:VOC family protein [Pseudomonadaceae bacterium]